MCILPEIYCMLCLLQVKSHRLVYKICCSIYTTSDMHDICRFQAISPYEILSLLNNNLKDCWEVEIEASLLIMQKDFLEKHTHWSPGISPCFRKRYPVSAFETVRGIKSRHLFRLAEGVTGNSLRILLILLWCFGGNSDLSFACLLCFNPFLSNSEAKFKSLRSFWKT